MRVSVTERSDFRRCLRKWFIESQNGLALRARGTSKALHLGAAVHHALAVHAREHHEPLEVLTHWWMHQTPMDELDNSQEQYDLAFDLVDQYTRQYNPAVSDLGEKLEYIAVEQTFRVLIPWPVGFVVPDDTEQGELIGTYDGIVRNTHTSELWIIDHKTYTQKARLEDIELNDQFTAYAWAFLQLTGQPPAGVIYDGVRKKSAPRPYHHQAGEQTEFFTRWPIRFSIAQLQSFEQRVAYEYIDMFKKRALGRTYLPGLYPNFAWQGCWDCHAARALCRAMEYGEDIQHLLDNYYKVDPGHTTVQNQKLTPQTISSLDDILTVGQASLDPAQDIAFLEETPREVAARTYIDAD